MTLIGTVCKRHDQAAIRLRRIHAVRCRTNDLIGQRERSLLSFRHLVWHGYRVRKDRRIKYDELKKRFRTDSHVRAYQK